MTSEDTIIIGAGPAGLACAAMLAERGQPSLVVEQGDSIAASWHSHYDRLHLHTHRNHSALPGKPMPRSYPKYPSRRQVIAYLQDYARSFGINVRLGERATGIRKGADWEVTTTRTSYVSPTVVVASGLAHTPVRPRWPGQQDFEGKLLHSSEYRNAQDLQAERVLVVGFGNSAGEIALECAEEQLAVGMSVRGPVNVIPRELLGIPTLSIAIAEQRVPYRWVDAMNRPFLRLRFGDIRRYGLKWAGQGPLARIIESGRTPLIDIGTMQEIKSGRIRVFGPIVRTEGRRVLFGDGVSEEFDAIVLATGFRPALDDLLPDCAVRFGESGCPQRGDLHPGGDGLYFCGFHVVPTGHLRQIGMEAQAIASKIVGMH